MRIRASRRVLFLLAAMCPLSVLLAAGPASAHTGFESSNPVGGSTIDAAVDVVTIAFSGAAEPAGEGFVVLDPSGAVRTPEVLSPDADRQVWSLGFDPPLTDGVVGVRWTVQAPDAHPISGSFSFTVEVANTPVDRETSVPVEPGDSDRRSFGEIASETIPLDGSPAAAGSDGSPAEKQDLEAFLQRSDQSAPKSAGVGAFGRLLGFVGTMLGIGGLTFGAVVVRNQRRDLRSVFTAVRYGALGVVTGSAIDFIAHLAVASNGWWEIFTAGAVQSATLSTFGFAIGLRMAAGWLLFANARIANNVVNIPKPVAPPRELVLAGNSRPFVRGELSWEGQTDGRLDVPPFGDRWSGPAGWPDDLELSRAIPADDRVISNERRPIGRDDVPISTASVVAVVLLLVSFTLDGHTVTEGNRWITGAVDMIHVVAASVWAGGVVAFAVVLWRRHRRRERLGGLEMALRFSVIAGAALAVAGIAGTVLAVIILD
ncbi:MAG: copper resistance protein CopC/CopD, partial [Acidimicrobiia bacterium]|nr:copper resistance protein CopC/CopD [Acidimicrobiia bacterium]